MGTTHPDARRRPAARSGIGRWAVRLAAASALGIVLSVVGFSTGLLHAASSFTDNLPLTVFAGLVMLAGWGAAGCGAVAIVRHHDRDVRVLLATLVGLLVGLALLREVLQGL